MKCGRNLLSEHLSSLFVWRNKIKKKLLIASGIKAKDAQAIIEESIDVSGPSAPGKAQTIISSSSSKNPLLNSNK